MTAAPDQTDFTPDSELEALLTELKRGTAVLDVATTGSLVCGGGWASRLFGAALTQSAPSSIRWAGQIHGDIEITGGGTLTGNIEIMGGLGALILTDTDLTGNIVLTPDSKAEPLRVLSLKGARLGSTMTLGEGVTLAHCDLRNFDDHDKLRVIGAKAFRCETDRCDGVHPEGGETDSNIAAKKPGKWPVIDRQHIRHQGIEPRELVGIYRRLRVEREKASDRPGASDFYYREMEGRRQAAKTGSRWERMVLNGYRAMSEYGTRAVLPAFWFGFVLMIGAGLLLGAGMNLGPDSTGAMVRASFGGSGGFLGDEVILFTFSSMVSFFRPPSTEYLTVFETVVQVGLRFLGPLLLAQFLFAVRERVAR